MRAGNKRSTHLRAVPSRLNAKADRFFFFDMTGREVLHWVCFHAGRLIAGQTRGELISTGPSIASTLRTGEKSPARLSGFSWSDTAESLFARFGRLGGGLVALILLGGGVATPGAEVFGVSLATACEGDCALEMKVIPSKILEKRLSATKLHGHLFA
jgi:hypothetical protein